MEIIVNGELKSITGENTTISDILRLLKVEMPDMVSVQLNGDFVERKKFDTVIIKNKDAVDFLYFMGGGAQ